MQSTIQEVFRTWKTYVGGEATETTQWVYVKSKVTAQQWSQAKSVYPLLSTAFAGTSTGASVIDSAAPSLPCFSQPDWIRKYTTRTGPDSLFHTLVRQAEHIGYHDPSTNHIRWCTFESTSSVDPLSVALHQLRQKPSLWSVLSKSCSQGPDVCHPWLFALCQASQRMDLPTKTGARRGGAVSYRELYSHLLFFQKLHYWTTRPRNVLEDIQNQPVISQIIRQYAYVHKSVYKQTLDLPGPHPGMFVRRALSEAPFVSLSPTTAAQTKNVVSPEEMGLIRVYGLSVHHLEDMGDVLGYRC